MNTNNSNSSSSINSNNNNPLVPTTIPSIISFLANRTTPLTTDSPSQASIPLAMAPLVAPPVIPRVGGDKLVTPA